MNIEGQIHQKNIDMGQTLLPFLGVPGYWKRLLLKVIPSDHQLPVIVVIKDEGDGDPAEPKSEGGEGEQPDVAHLKQTAVKQLTNKQRRKKNK